MVCVVCGPSLFNTRLPQPAREAQLLHEALTSQLTRDDGSPLFDHCAAPNLIFSAMRFAVCGGSSPTMVISALSRTLVLTVLRPVRNI